MPFGMEVLMLMLMLTADVLLRSWLECWRRGSGGEERILCSRRDRARLKSMARISFDRVFVNEGIDVMARC